jgi:hypothetical protein
VAYSLLFLAAHPSLYSTTDRPNPSLPRPPYWICRLPRPVACRSPSKKGPGITPPLAPPRGRLPQIHSRLVRCLWRLTPAKTPASGGSPHDKNKGPKPSRGTCPLIRQFCGASHLFRVRCCNAVLLNRSRAGVWVLPWLLGPVWSFGSPTYAKKAEQPE